VTDEEKLRKQIEEEYDRKVRRAAVFIEGLQSPFWKELKEMLSELERSAFERFTDANAADQSVIIELQQIGKLGRVLEARIRSAIDEADHLTQ
jgi:hypothetical protein